MFRHPAHLPFFTYRTNATPNFTGRTSLLAELQHRMNTGQRVQVIHGLGGIGKSNVAAEFAYRHREDYSVIWWVPADSGASIAASFANLITRLGKRLSYDAPPQLLRDTVSVLLARRNWLLIFDAAPRSTNRRAFSPLAGEWGTS